MTMAKISRNKTPITQTQLWKLEKIIACRSRTHALDVEKHNFD